MFDALTRFAMVLPTDAQAVRLLQRGEAYRAGTRLPADARRQPLTYGRDSAVSRPRVREGGR